jgi:hypothetical protein
MDNLTPLFVGMTALALCVEAIVFVLIYIAIRKSTVRLEALVTEVKGKVLPVVEQAEIILTEVRPKLQVITENLQESTILLREQVKRADATVKDAMDRGRLQIIRADELLTRTMDRVEQTSDIVHNTVISPVRRLSGLVQGLTAGLEFLFSGRGRRNGGSRERRPVPQDEMFI